MDATFRFERPSAPLRGWVRQHQLIRFRFPFGVSVPPKPYWPRPAACLAFYLRDRERVGCIGDSNFNTKPRAVLIGQPTTTTMRQGGTDFSVYQIEFEPGALFQLTGIPLCELRDTYIDAEAVFPLSFRSLVNRLEDEDNGDLLIAHAETFLMDFVSGAKRERVAVDAIAKSLLSGNARIDHLADATGIGVRQLNRQFLLRTGVNPKLIHRIARFDRAVRLANGHPSETWLGVALDAGYHDHQHLARDFKTFTGMSPAAFANLEERAPERAFSFQEV